MKVRLRLTWTAVIVRYRKQKRDGHRPDNGERVACVSNGHANTSCHATIVAQPGQDPAWVCQQCAFPSLFAQGSLYNNHGPAPARLSSNCPSWHQCVKISNPSCFSRQQCVNISIPPACLDSDECHLAQKARRHSAAHLPSALVLKMRCCPRCAVHRSMPGGRSSAESTAGRHKQRQRTDASNVTTLHKQAQGR